MQHCGLAPLPGRGALSGDILSHDFVEAALMRRAGYHVWLLPGLVGSYEQLCGSGQAFGPGDYRPVGDVFHGIASEWGQTPQHWKAWGCDPSLQGAAAWKDKQKHFGSWPDRIDLKKLAKCFESPQSGGAALENPWDYAAAGAQKICNWGQFPIKVYKVPIREVFRQLQIGRAHV